MKRILYIISMLCLASCVARPKPSAAEQKPRYYSYMVKSIHPHSEQSYTQGLEFSDGQLWESTGLYGQSRLLKVDLESGEKREIAKLKDSEFGEGITILGDTIYQITWRENVAYIYSKSSGKLLDRRHYGGEGWGLTHDGERIYLSSGNEWITLRDRESFAARDSIRVELNGQAIPYLNELEWIEGRIWANVYTTDQILIIDPASGRVEGVVDLTGLLPQSERKPETDVLNGIAYNPETKKIYVTGKNWSKLFEIELIEK
ncbi:MAG: glutaminyl-peptide cyclotransferase [Rikenellaceae bacterium]